GEGTTMRGAGGRGPDGGGPDGIRPDAGGPDSIRPDAGGPDGIRQDGTGPGGGAGERALVLVRLHTAPIGTLVTDAPGGVLDATSCARAAWASLAAQLGAHLEADGLDRRPPVPGQPDGSLPACRREAAAVHPAAPPVPGIV